MQAREIIEKLRYFPGSRAFGLVFTGDSAIDKRMPESDPLSNYGLAYLPSPLGDRLPGFINHPTANWRCVQDHQGRALGQFAQFERGPYCIEIEN